MVTESPIATCYRHPDRVTRIYCRRCNRPICGECMVAAAVGFQCPDCVRQDRRTTRRGRGLFGGQTPTNPRLTTIVLIVINAVVWGVIQLAGHWQSRLIDFLGLMPTGYCQATNSPGMYFPNAGKMACQAMANGQWLPGAADGAWWQVVTSIFTHVWIVHLGLNCLTLFFLGPPLESLLGRARFLATYGIAGLAGSLAVLLFTPVNTVSYGASGALFGLMGALLVLFWRRRLDIRQLLLWLGLNIVMTFVQPNISWQAHLGGLFGGALVAVILAFVPATKRSLQWALLAVVAVVIVAGMVLRALVLTT